MLSKLDQVVENDEKNLRHCFDEIMSEALVDDADAYLRGVVNELIPMSAKCVHALDHPLFVQLRSRFTHTLEQSVADYELAHSISELFVQLVKHIDERNLRVAQHLFVDSDLCDCLVISLKSLTSTSDDKLVDGIENMIDVYRKIQEDHLSVPDDSILNRLIMSIVDSIKSVEYRLAFLQLSPTEDRLTHYQQFLLITCPKYVTSYRGHLQEEIISSIVQEVLNRSSFILAHVVLSIENWKEPMIYCISQLILLCQRCANQYLLPAYDQQHQKILNSILTIIQEKRLWSLLTQTPSLDQHEKRVHQLFCYSTLYIYTMTFLPELRNYLKEHQMIPILLKLTDIKYDKTQFHAYRALAALLTEDDMKQLPDPGRIITVFMSDMRKSIDSLGLRQRLENLLLSLKSKFIIRKVIFERCHPKRMFIRMIVLTQHDRIKDELVKVHDGLSLLLRCAMESQFNETKIQLHALKILMSLTFHNGGKSLLENKHGFLDHLRVIIKSSKLMDFQNIADGILWRLSSKDEKTESKYQYDMMISYAHKDKDICHQIHKSLINDNYRVWIDLERMHGIIMEAIANAIEQSRCVLICMSDNYSLSPYCQSEAQYAFEKRRLLIPLKVQDGFKPQGWLAFTISGRMYVDFIKMDFQSAYQQLRSQFYQNQIDKKDVSSKPVQSNLTEEPNEKHDSLWDHCFYARK